MKKMGLVGMVAGTLSAVVIGFAGPAQADNGNGSNGNDVRGRADYSFNGGFHYGYGRDHRNNPWLGQLFPTVKVPQVDTTVRNSPSTGRLTTTNRPARPARR
jgi:hypothetical protein